MHHISSNLRHNKIQANQSRKMEQKYYFTCNIRNIKDISALQRPLSVTGCDSRQWRPLCSAVTLCPLASTALFPTAACHYSAFNHLLRGGGNKAAMTTPAHIWCLCSHPVTVFMGHKMIAGHFSDGRVQNAGRLLKWL